METQQIEIKYKEENGASLYWTMLWNSNYVSFISVALDQHIVGACWLNCELINRYIFYFFTLCDFYSSKFTKKKKKTNEVYFLSVEIVQAYVVICVWLSHLIPTTGGRKR